MVTFPNAKINLGLQILEKRPDGYHNIASVFYPIGWCDILEIVPADDLCFTTSGLPIPGDPTQNLILKAYRAIQEKAPSHILPVHIHLHKIIPMGAGLGGGSADAAFALTGLNDLFQVGLSPQELEDLARPLGSDCAFFIRNQPAYCYHKGDEFEDISTALAGLHVWVIYPNLHISTAEAYQQVKPNTNQPDIREIWQQSPRSWQNQLKNDFEAGLASRYPIIPEIKAQLYQQGALYAAMTGSGSTVYGIFEGPISVKQKEVFSGLSQWDGPLH